MRQKTQDTYDRSADSLSQHYDAIGPRIGDVDLAFTLAENPQNAQVLELGCGNGRDARAILRHTPHYTGIDTSPKMIAIARDKLALGTFLVEDATTYEYGGPFDIVFAFALIRHLDVNELSTVLRKVAVSLRPGGILYISSVYGRYHQQEPRSDSYGTRTMYSYNPHIVQKYSPPSLKKVQEIYDTIGGVEWFELALRKTDH